MSALKLSDTLAQEALDAVTQYGAVRAAANALGIPPETLRNRRDAALTRGLKPSGVLIEQSGDEPAQLKRQVQRLEVELKSEKKRVLDEEAVRSYIIKLTKKVADIAPPAWLSAQKKASAPGVPTLMLSDLHWGEIVKPSQINGVNEYNLKIAHRRLDTVINTSESLLRIISPTNEYPGIVVILGGDMISGDIHEELQVTNQIATMPTVLDLWAKLESAIRYLADTYGHVFLPCVTGNHGRNTHKIWNKDRHATSFDWLLYCLLAKRFENDSRVQFFIPDGPDAYFRIYNHRYLLTHGDQFRGGDGMIGALGPITRGNHKKQSRNAQIDMAYDTLVMGHWHQEIFLRKLIVNSSLKGYDEYAYNNNFGYEPPSQQLWVTHPSHGPTWHMPVFADRVKKPAKTDWVAVPA